MRMVDLIHRKKQGYNLSKAEIEYMVQGYTAGIIPDYQMSAFLMAVCFQGMSKEEIANLTLALVNSGDRIDLSGIDGIKVDKHSTGGVGDKISLIVVPLVACVGVPVAKMSGRGLGHTGGTIDKLESIEGFRTDLGREQFISNVNTYKMAIVGQSANLTPADKKLYALRDVTATVDSLPLIASSVMSKKIASGADAIVLDVKVGSGAFVKTLEEASELAGTMVEIGKALNRRTIAIITDMNQPLGHEVGNANEVKEAIDVLNNKGSEDETTVALTIASNMAVLGGAYADFESAYRDLGQIIELGRAIEKLRELIRIQGGNPDVVDYPDILPQAKYHIEIKSLRSGYVESIDTEHIGISAMLLGAGRKTKEDVIDYSAGITMVKKIGDFVNEGDILCVLHTNLEKHHKSARAALAAFDISPIKPEKPPYVYRIIK
jgi:pyrimidine-nucleoside phosphorylase/thymidine phosphorylase